jgi:hypothetical protein
MIPGMALLAGSVVAAAHQQKAPPPPPKSFESVNVCERIPGSELAGAVGGRLLETRPVNIKDFAPARCVYTIEIKGAKHGFVVWLSPPDDYAGLRKAADPPLKPISGVGEQAHVTFDKDTKRYQLTAVRAGKVTIQVTGEQEGWIEAMAKLTLSKF